MSAAQPSPSPARAAAGPASAELVPLPAAAPGSVLSMRDQIKTVATEMLIRHGYRGFRFQHVADAVDVTRANIHYHYGTKGCLAEQAIVDYTSTTLSAFREIWADPATTLRAKIERTMRFNLQRYRAFNPSGQTGHPWSLIARMRLERDLLSEKARQALLDFGTSLDAAMRQGITLAVRKGELRPDAPVEDLALQLVSIANSAGPITQDAGSFDRLEQLYLGFARIVEHAYGDGKGRPQAPPTPAADRD